MVSMQILAEMEEVVELKQITKPALEVCTANKSEKLRESRIKYVYKINKMYNNRNGENNLKNKHFFVGFLSFFYFFIFFIFAGGAFKLYCDSG